MTIILIRIIRISKTSNSQIDGYSNDDAIRITKVKKYIRRASPSNCYRRVWSHWMKWDKEKVLKSDLDGKEFDFQSNTDSSERICAGK